MQAFGTASQVIRGDGNLGSLSDLPVSQIYYTNFDGNNINIPQNILLGGMLSWITRYCEWIHGNFIKTSSFFQWEYFNHSPLNGVITFNNLGSRVNPLLSIVELHIDFIVPTVGIPGDWDVLVSEINKSVKAPLNNIDFSLTSTNGNSNLFRIYPDNNGQRHRIKPIYSGLNAGERYIGFITYIKE